MWTYFKNSFTAGFYNKFATRPLLCFPPHFKHVTTLPCTTCAADMFDFQRSWTCPSLWKWTEYTSILELSLTVHTCVLPWHVADWAATACHAWHLWRFNYLPARVSLPEWELTAFISPDKNPDLSTVDYTICGEMQKVDDIYELKQRTVCV